MAQQNVQRRLAAILAADVVGYSRMMQADEVGTLATLKSRRSEILQPLVAKHHGRIVKMMGDGVLVEFASVLNAVQCGIQLQEAMTAANLALPKEQRIELRVGINQGDVIVEGSDIYGDGVNIAARLETLADPGSVFVSGKVHQEIDGKLGLSFEDLGQQSLKNLAAPVQVYRVFGALPAATTNVVADTTKRSIAVLPFTNMSGDPEQQYFSDGITEDIITELSRFRSLVVIARHSSFQFRDKGADVRRVGRDLGVRYVAEGSVRRTGDHLRITAQLVDATTGAHLWSERYDRALADIFAVQDAVVQAIVASVAGRVTAAEIEQVRRNRTGRLDAYECCLRGLGYWQQNSAEANAESYRWLEKAANLDPEYAEPLTRLSISAAVRASEDASDFEPALALATKAVALDPNNSWSHCALGIAKLLSGAVAGSAEHFRIAQRLNPNDPDQMHWCAMYHIYAGEFAAAHALLAAAERLNPLRPIWYMGGKAISEYGLRHYAGAAELFEGLTSDPRSWEPNYWVHCYLASCYERLGRTLEAKRQVARAFELKPDLSLRAVAVTEPYVRADDLEHLLEPLRKMGLPE
jgi:TolB-like protein/class 3 adenylate cyclase/Flp pilus assembly protein TadD